MHLMTSISLRMVKVVILSENSFHFVRTFVSRMLLVKPLFFLKYRPLFLAPSVLPILLSIAKWKFPFWLSLCWGLCHWLRSRWNMGPNFKPGQARGSIQRVIRRESKTDSYSKGPALFGMCCIYLLNQLWFRPVQHLKMTVWSSVLWKILR